MKASKNSSTTKKPERPRKARVVPLNLIRIQAFALGPRLNHLIAELQLCESAINSLADQIEDFEAAQKGGAA